MKKQVEQKDLINWWLEKYHNTNLDKILEENSEWQDNPQQHSREFYIKYPVTKEQHSEWEIWAKEYIRQVTKLSKKIIDRNWWSVYLDCSPNIKEDEREITE